ncbi:hypothetical protein JX265_003733 [Neoarthrinium moseri]|uniref:Dol-P-Glc:Glc(2)Man(9)GlcNAc(2)-PP-Dol alpha-1,2-glucosyltransferase n=1 Tax=Neoarthrinium moseri TaxID=1658444 RepID=A0A9P9WSE3_9PEZI|nr:hypothetical protein JX265_003733 [Neoarthrinium moseri]
MSSVNEHIDFLLTPNVLRATVGAAVLGLTLCTHLATTKARGQTLWGSTKQCVQTYTLPVLIPACLGWLWLQLVNKTVPEPYLDEFFHIPQAQVYCEGRYFDWDDKITTPPGLYVLSIIWARLAGYTDCSADTLRAFNVFVISCTAAVAGACRSAIEDSQPGRQSSSAYSLHTAVNIALFPVLFFFSGLYYTDVLSTCIVLLCYLNHLGRTGQGSSRRSVLNDLYTVFLGVLALFMRQTNVFWVVVYMGGLEAIQAIRDLPVSHKSPRMDTWIDHVKLFTSRSSSGAIHDPSLDEAWPEDLVLCVVSIGIAAIANLGTVLKRVYPHIITMALFAGFVAWNGGVVLGDKSNHVATLHLAQMLYIWPLFAFFSAPLFLPQALHVLQCVLGRLSSKPAKVPAKKGQKQEQPAKHNYPGIGLSAVLLVLSLGIAAVIVRFNTIIHPFTLADNRHYMFYIFRYTILKGNTVRLALVPVYVLCAVLSWTALYRLAPATSKTSKTGAPARRLSPSTSPRASTVILLLLTTTLSLVTAPLVEPRYFILPWVFWRLLVPQRMNARRTALDWVLGLETIWFLAVNAATMYIFLTRPFYWRSEDGTVLDGGNVQRFMW